MKTQANTRFIGSRIRTFDKSAHQVAQSYDIKRLADKVAQEVKKVLEDGNKNSEATEKSVKPAQQ
jgi:hypothetical protein